MGGLVILWLILYIYLVVLATRFVTAHESIAESLKSLVSRRGGPLDGLDR